MATKLLSKGDLYEIAPGSEIIDETPFSSGIVYDDQIAGYHEPFWPSLKNIFRKEERYTYTDSELFSDILEVGVPTLRRSDYIIISSEIVLFPHVDEGVVLRNKEEILNFLDSHPEINTYLYEAKRIIHKYFPTEQLEAELVTDFEPQIEDRKKILFLNIITNTKPEKALEILEKVDEEIFENLQIDSQFFNINLEFKS